MLKTQFNFEYKTFGKCSTSNKLFRLFVDHDGYEKKNIQMLINYDLDGTETKTSIYVTSHLVTTHNYTTQT